VTGPAVTGDAPSPPSRKRGKDVTAAARMRRMRARRKAEAEAERRKARGYSWEPFQKDNTVSTLHGAYGRKAKDLAAEIEQNILEFGPPHLRGEHAMTFHPLIREYCFILAQLECLRVVIGEEDLVTVLTERTVTRKGQGRNRTVREKTESAMTFYNSLAARLVTLSKELIVSPAAMVRAGLQLEARQPNLMELMSAAESQDG
jgi:hypothetical protein